AQAHAERHPGATGRRASGGGQRLVIRSDGGDGRGHRGRRAVRRRVVGPHRAGAPSGPLSAAACRLTGADRLTGAGEVGAGKVGAGEVGAGEVGAGEVGAAARSAVRTGASRRGTSRIGMYGSASGGRPAAIARARPSSASNSAPSRIATLVSHSHTRKMITPPSV